ncbi:hypothetical protein D3C73_535440 [compost metagenome]
MVSEGQVDVQFFWIVQMLTEQVSNLVQLLGNLDERRQQRVQVWCSQATATEGVGFRYVAVRQDVVEQSQDGLLVLLRCHVYAVGFGAFGFQLSDQWEVHDRYTLVAFAFVGATTLDEQGNHPAFTVNRQYVQQVLQLLQRNVVHVRDQRKELGLGRRQLLVVLVVHGDAHQLRHQAGGHSGNTRHHRHFQLTQNRRLTTDDGFGHGVERDLMFPVGLQQNLVGRQHHAFTCALCRYFLVADNVADQCAVIGNEVDRTKNGTVQFDDCHMLLSQGVKRLDPACGVTIMLL